MGDPQVTMVENTVGNSTKRYETMMTPFGGTLVLEPWPGLPLVILVMVYGFFQGYMMIYLLELFQEW